MTEPDLEEILRPLRSLLSKSGKAQRRLAPGTWQHNMLDRNVRALRLGLAALGDRTPPAGQDVASALAAFAAMVETASAARARFAKGTPQHTLQANRLRALRAAQRRVARMPRP